MELTYAIEAIDIRKKFKVYIDKGTTIKERVISWKRNRYQEEWVLNGISFCVKQGESIGLIGQNGCGKSTLLKILTRIMYPDAGKLKIQGRVSSLLELGAGFHPDMTGIENIYINASIFGLTKKAIDDRLQSIIEFAELGDHISNPVRTYSSGMYMRLAFAVAINVNADILLIDEILAVGDVNFQTKCFNKLMEIKKNGTTIVLVSHSTDQIEKVCERSIWINNGTIQMDGKPRDVHKEYLKFMGETRRETIRQEISEPPGSEDRGENEKKSTSLGGLLITDENVINRRGSGEARIVSVKTMDNKDADQSVFQVGEDIKFHISYKVLKPVRNIYFGLSIFKDNGALCYGTNMSVEGIQSVCLERDGAFSLLFTEPCLMQGKYYADVCIATGADEMIDYCDTVAFFEIYQLTKEVGTFYMTHKWIG